MPDLMNCVRNARLALFLPAMALAGCHIEQAQENPVNLVVDHTFDSANWQQGNAVIETQVEPVSLVHVMNFAPGESRLSDDELARLREFLQKSDLYDEARIEVDGPRLSGGYFDPLTRSRLEEIRAQLSDLGLHSQIPARPITLLAKPEGSIAVTVTRAMVIPPDCSAPQPAPHTRPSYSWSCANAANLGAMVADPVDLVRGQTPNPADGEAVAKSVERYRKRDIEDPTAQKTSE